MPAGFRRYAGSARFHGRSTAALGRRDQREVDALRIETLNDPRAARHPVDGGASAVVLVLKSAPPNGVDATPPQLIADQLVKWGIC